MQQPQQYHSQQPMQQQYQSQQQPMPQKGTVSYQLPADDKDGDPDFGLKSTSQKHKMQRMATSALEEIEPDEENGEFYVPKAERGHEWDTASSYSGGPDGYVPKVPALGATKEQCDDAIAKYHERNGGKPRNAGEVAARAGRGGEPYKANRPGRAMKS